LRHIATYSQAVCLDIHKEGNFRCLYKNHCSPFPACPPGFAWSSPQPELACPGAALFGEPAQTVAWRAAHVLVCEEKEWCTEKKYNLDYFTKIIQLVLSWRLARRL
jgi:hypothetical protein